MDGFHDKSCEKGPGHWNCIGSDRYREWFVWILHRCNIRRDGLSVFEQCVGNHHGDSINLCLFNCDVRRWSCGKETAVSRFGHWHSIWIDSSVDLYDAQGTKFSTRNNELDPARCLFICQLYCVARRADSSNARCNRNYAGIDQRRRGFNLCHTYINSSNFIIKVLAHPLWSIRIPLGDVWIGNYLFGWHHIHFDIFARNKKQKLRWHYESTWKLR